MGSDVVTQPQPPSGTSAGVTGARWVDHVAVAVRDADSAAAWYVDRLAFEVTEDERLPHVGVRLVYLRPPGIGPSDATAIQLAQPIGPGAVSDFVATQGEGLHHVCFAVDDIDAFLSTVPGEDSASVFQGGRQRRACFLTAQPNGVLIELTEVHSSYTLDGEAR